nr:RHS repeat-associated core domain-containing protein [Pseudomonas moorei]
MDRTTGCYILGNGYRLYSPTLQAFYSPDAVSPFGAGGVNRYQYCGLDPVNNTDPIGSNEFKRWALPWLKKGLIGAVADMFRGGAETIRENDPSYQPDQTRGDAYDPKSARILDQVASGIDNAGFFVGNMVGAAAPALRPGKVGGGSVTVGDARGSGGLKIPWFKGSNSTTRGFKAYKNSAGGTVYLTKMSTDSRYVKLAMMEARAANPLGRVNVISGTHGNSRGIAMFRQSASRKFYIQDVASNSENIIKARTALASVSIYDVHQHPGLLSTNIQAIFNQAAQSPHSTIFAFCYSGLNTEIRAQLGLNAIRAPWRWSV